MAHVGRARALYIKLYGTREHLNFSLIQIHINKTMEVKTASSLDSYDERKEYDVASSTTEDVSTCSDRSSKCSQPVDDGKKSMEVKVTVISLDGVLAKRYQSKSKLTTKQKKTQKSVDITANIVASFSQDLSNQKVDFFTHLPSLPIEMSESSSNSNNPVVKWPTTSNVEEKQVLSTVQHTREFHRETTSDDNTSSSSTKNRFVPQMCPINISISRHGKLIKLGKANLFISGEEKGDATINIPIFSTTKEEKSNAKKNSSVKKVKGSKKSKTPMMRIKGDSLQFGLKSDAMLRMLVSVADRHRVDKCEEEESTSVEGMKEEIIEEPACVSFNDDDDCECVFDDDDSIEQDDYEDYIKAANESNEVRLLKQQLRNSEDMIQNLQTEHNTTRIAQQQEIEQLRRKLEQATQNSETLLQELNESKSQSEIVPFLETRINDFMAELKKKDMEIECLREEVTEVRQYYRSQVDTLLWDDQDAADNTIAANWKAAIGSAALKATKHIRDREVDNSFSTQDEEKTNDAPIEGSADEFLWDNQNVKEGNRAANWRAAIGTAALRARQHLLERENRQRDVVVEEISAMSGEEKNNDAIEEPTASEEESDIIVTMEESTNTEEKDDCDQPLAGNSTEKDRNDTVYNSGRAANWKNAIGSAFRRDVNAEKLTVGDKGIVCQMSSQKMCSSE